MSYNPLLSSPLLSSPLFSSPLLSSPLLSSPLFSSLLFSSLLLSSFHQFLTPALTSCTNCEPILFTLCLLSNQHSTTDGWRNKSINEISKSEQNRSTSETHHTDTDSEAVSLIIERMGNLVIPVQSLFQQLSSKTGMMSNKDAIGNELTSYLKF